MSKALTTVGSLTALLVACVAVTPAMADDAPSEIPPRVAQAAAPVAFPPGITVSSVERRIEQIDAMIATLQAREQRLTRSLQRAGMQMDAAQRDAEEASRSLRSVGDGADDLAEVASSGVALVRASLQSATAERRLADVRASVERDDTLANVFALQTKIADLQADRVRQATIADQLRSASAVVDDGALTREEWAGLFLAHSGLPACDENVALLVAWETQEGTQAGWNPLATTLPMPGAGLFNSVGVRDYVSVEQGLEATRQTLIKGSIAYGYGWILRSLAQCAPAEATARFVNASAWCSGCTNGAYLTGLLPIVRANYSFYASITVGTTA